MELSEAKQGISVVVKRDFENWKKRHGVIVGEPQISDIVDVETKDGTIPCWPFEMEAV